ncbi:hypothetical protein IVB12_32415, partial [Bradyrhizobium sp. 179]|nr:hypothetical protein [Bradyrhizobium sp. 179]
KLKTYLGRIIRDIGRKLGGNADLLAGIVLERMLARARRVLEQKQHRRGPKVYSLHAPEVECIGKGKAHRPYEFGVKVSVATSLAHAKGGQFVTHVKAPPGNPYDGHTLATVIPDMEALIGNTLERLLADKGYRGHNAPPDYKFRVFTSGQKRRVTPQITRELRRRSAVEPVIGHLKSEHRMGRNYLWHREGDASNAVLAAVGYNFRGLICWLRLSLWQILAILFARPESIQPEFRVLHGRRLMRGVIVHDEMDLEFARHSGLDLVVELTEFGSTATSLALRRWLVLSQCRERRTAMWCHIFFSHPSFGPAGRDASAAWWLRSSARIATSHPRIERHRAPAAGRKGPQRRALWPRSLDRGELEGLRPVRLEPEARPDALHGRHRQAAGLRHAAGIPMDGVLRATLQGPHDRGFDAGILNRTRGPKRGSPRAAPQNAAPYPRPLKAQLGRHFLVLTAFRAGQHDSRSQRQHQNRLPPRRQRLVRHELHRSMSGRQVAGAPSHSRPCYILHLGTATQI